MKLNLTLPKLPFGLGSRGNRRQGRFGDDDHGTGAIRRFPLPPVFPSVIVLTIGLVIGIFLWVWLNADDTLKELAHDAPQLRIPVAGGAPPLPEPSKPSTPAKPGEHESTAAKGAETPEKPAAAATPQAANGPGPDEVFPLAKAPASGLVEDTRNGLIPIIGADGRKPWEVYARPYASAEKGGRIALVIGQMGVAGAATGLALQRLPPGVTLSFVPIADRLEGWIDTARGQGHEVMLSVPMEPLNYPHDDPGPNTLLLSLDPAHNIDRLEWAMGRFTGYIGITSPSGTHFGSDGAAMRPVLEDIKKRGLIFLDAGTAPRSIGDTLANDLSVAHARVDRIIDQDPSRGSIDSQLEALEGIAHEQGAAVGMGDPFPTTLERIAKWVPLLPDKKLTLVPLSAVVNLQKSLPAPQPEEKH